MNKDKKIKIAFCVSLVLVLAFLGAASKKGKETIYISPNNDGVQDTLEMPVKIKEKRYITEWNFIIENSKGKVVRTIANKENRDQSITAKNLFAQLKAKKASVAVPQSIAWNGILDDGSVAPDGTYYYYMTATDDNKNKATTAKMQVIVDNTPPQIDITQLSDDDKIFGEGEKANLLITQTGSKEDLWQAAFLDAGGEQVRTFEYKTSQPKNISWDGIKDTGDITQDGVYSYKITATDKAGNTTTQVVNNIIYSAEKPNVNLAINGSRYFSPGTQSPKNQIKFDLTIPEPKSSNKLVSWVLQVQDEDKNTLRTYKGTKNPPKNISFDGKADTGKILSDGKYKAFVTATYLNGYKTKEVYSPVFVLDTTPPQAKIDALTYSTFSPSGDSSQAVLPITQASSTEPLWTGKIINSSGQVVQSFDFGSEADPEVEWDGTDTNGNLCSDGEYVYELSATDLAGNFASFKSQNFSLDTSKTELLLSASPTAFSLLQGAGKVDFSIQAKSTSGITGYEFIIQTKTGSSVYSQKQEGPLPQKFIWQGVNSDTGEKCPDGVYVGVLSVDSANGTQSRASSQSIILDSTPPDIAITPEYVLFSPDNDTLKDTVPFVCTSSKEILWTGQIKDNAGNIIRTFNWEGVVPNFAWDGTDTSGNTAPDGIYSLDVFATDIAGNKNSATISNITLDTRPTKAWLTTSLDAFSPNQDGFKDIQDIKTRLSLAQGIKSWQISIKDSKGKIIQSWKMDDSSPTPPSLLQWDGKDSTGQIAEGVFSAGLSLEYEKGNKVDITSASFISCITPPKLAVTTAPEFFSPDNDGEADDLFINLKVQTIVPLSNWDFVISDPQNKKFYAIAGKTSVAENIIWDGRSNKGELVQSAVDYPYNFTVKDSLGLSSTATGKIPIDVLLVRDGDYLKMQVPSIIFRADNADFKSEAEVKNGLAQSVIDNNIRVLKRVAEILKKFSTYTVVIEGHANNISGTEAEETSTAGGNIPLVPLSQARAEFVLEQLNLYGIEKSRLSAKGIGGRKPVVKHSDKENWWKNRRVEFILKKK